MSNDSDKDQRDGEGLSRRGALAAAAITGVAAVTGIAAASAGGAPHAASTGSTMTNTTSTATPRSPTGRMPVVFLPHGGGPWPFMDLAFGTQREKDDMLAYLRGVPASIGARPTALVVLSAHWEEPVVTVMNGERPPLLFDYYGFPPETYRIEWPAPGQPTVAARVQSLLRAAGIATASNSTRGYDHGTFVPLKVAWPEADVPVVQVSLKTGLDPAEHLAIGRALAPLRDEGVLIVGSGMTYHNMRGFLRRRPRPARLRGLRPMASRGHRRRACRARSHAARVGQRPVRARGPPARRALDPAHGRRWRRWLRSRPRPLTTARSPTSGSARTHFG
jgi:aromatic ring-opening dioxygenase catalytic subunit (LigB family)